MTAADAREELEAMLWRAGAAAVHHRVNQHLSPGQVKDILAAADKYAQACADDAWSAAEGQQRLAVARAEHSPATMPRRPA
jgi:hypothetical protein